MAAQNPNSWTQEQPRPPQGRLLTSTSTPPAPFMTSTPTATNLATTRNMEEEPSVPRNEMSKFAGLKACLRKPCPWKEQCRNLHVPYGEKGNTWNVIKKCKFSPFRRTYEMSREPAPVPASRTKARPEGQIKPTQGVITEEEERGKRKLPQEIETIQIKEPHKILLRGHACGNQVGREDDEEEEEVKN